MSKLETGCHGLQVGKRIGHPSSPRRADPVWGTDLVGREWLVAFWAC